MYYDDRNNYFDYETKLNEENDLNLNLTNININNFNQFRKDEVTDIIIGFNRGNLFNDIYDNYKNHNYKVIVKNEKDNLLLKIQMLSFAINDLGLYLDLNPDNQELISLFNNYSEQLKICMESYEKTYGPLSIEGVKYSNYYSWIKNPWPWEKGGDF